MKIPDDADIPKEKLTGYFLVPRPDGDKSKFLAQAGFSLDNPNALMDALRRLATEAEAEHNEETEYGVKYLQRGRLLGPHGIALHVTLVWIRRHADDRFRLVTLVPEKKPRHEP